jgi:hypothetical protein
MESLQAHPWTNRVDWHIIYRGRVLSSTVRESEKILKGQKDSLQVDKFVYISGVSGDVYRS